MENDTNNSENKILNVKERLGQLDKWKREYDEENQRLTDELHLLGDNKQDIQRGIQIIHLQKAALYRIIKEPIYLDFKTIKNIGLDKYRCELINQYSTLTSNEKKLWLNNLLFILTPKLKELDDKINYLINLKTFGQGRNLLISGESGSGKSTYLFWRASKEPARVLDEVNEVPIIFIQCPVNNKSSLYLFRRIITSIGNVYLAGDNDEDLYGKAVLYIKKCKVIILILDEINHLKQVDLKRRILELSNDTEICIIGSAVNAVHFTEGDPEIAGRFRDNIILGNYLGKDFYALLAIIDLLLPFPMSSQLYKREINTIDGKIEGPALFIMRVTHGLIRDMMRLIYDASLLALENNESCISIETLHLAWNSIQHQDMNTMLEKVSHDK